MDRLPFPYVYRLVRGRGYCHIGTAGADGTPPSDDQPALCGTRPPVGWNPFGVHMKQDHSFTYCSHCRRRFETQRGPEVQA